MSTETVYGTITAGALRAALARVPDDAPVMVAYHGDALAVTHALPGGAWGLVLWAVEPLDDEAEEELTQAAL